MTLGERLACLFLLATAQVLPQQARAPLAREMDEAARVASVMIDGDVCQRIQTPRSLGWMLKAHPKDPWFASDNFDVDHEAFTAVK